MLGLLQARQAFIFPRNKTWPKSRETVQRRDCVLCSEERLCLVESQDICLVETQDMCCVGSLDKKEAFPKSLKREVNIAFDNHFEVTLGGILVAKGAWTNWPIHILVTLADSK